MSTRSERVGLSGGDRGHEIDAIGAAFGARRREQVGFGCRAERAGHGAGVAQHARETTRVDAGNPGNSARGQHRVEARLGPMVAVAASQVANDHPTTVRPRCLVVDGRGAVVADVRIRERDDLTGITRVGDHLLVSRQHGVEHHFTGRDRRLGSDRLPFEYAAIGQNEGRLTNRHGHPLQYE